jgi:hypothetical protein
MSKEKVQGYPERWVWAACAHIYGDPISDRTWRNYKRICKAPDFRKLKKGEERVISKTHCQWLMMLAHIRFEQKRENGTKRPVGCKSGVTLPQIVKRLNSSPALKQSLDDALGDAVIIEGVKGAEVPAWLGRQVGKCPSIPTLRRWAKKYGLEFSTHLPVPPKTLDKFLQVA